MNTVRFSMMMRGFVVLALVMVAVGCTQKVTLTIDVAPEGAGTVTRDPERDTYRKGDEVTLTAVPAEGNAFSEWDGDLSGAQNPLVVTLDKNMEVIARFTMPDPVEGEGEPVEGEGEPAEGEGEPAEGEDELEVILDDNEVPAEESMVVPWITPSETVATTDTATEEHVTQSFYTQVLHENDISEYRLLVSMDSDDAVESRINARAGDPSFVAVFRYLGAICIINQITDEEENLWLSMSMSSAPGDYSTPLGNFTVVSGSNQSHFVVHTVGPVASSVIAELQSQMPEQIALLEDIPILVFEEAGAEKNAALYPPNTYIVPFASQKNLGSFLDNIFKKAILSLTKRATAVQLVENLWKTISLTVRTLDNSVRLVANMGDATASIADFHNHFGDTPAFSGRTPLMDILADCEPLVDPTGATTDTTILAGDIAAGFATADAKSGVPPIVVLGTNLWGDGSNIGAFLQDLVDALNISAEAYFYTIENDDSGIYLRMNTTSLRYEGKLLEALIAALRGDRSALNGADPDTLQQGYGSSAQESGRTKRTGASIQDRVVSCFHRVYNGNYAPGTTPVSSRRIWDVTFSAGVVLSAEASVEYIQSANVGFGAALRAAADLASPSLVNYSLNARTVLFGQPVSMSIDTFPPTSAYVMLGFSPTVSGGLGQAGIGASLRISAKPDVGVRLGMTSMQDFADKIEIDLYDAVLYAVGKLSGASFAGDGLSIIIPENGFIPLLGYALESFIVGLEEVAGDMTISIGFHAKAGIGPAFEVGNATLNVGAKAAIEMPLDLAFEIFSPMLNPLANPLSFPLGLGTAMAYVPAADGTDEGDRFAQVKLADFARDLVISYQSNTPSNAAVMLTRFANECMVYGGLAVSPQARATAGVGIGVDVSLAASLGTNMALNLFAANALLCNRAFVLEDTQFCAFLNTLGSLGTPKVRVKCTSDINFAVNSQADVVKLGGGLKNDFFVLEISAGTTSSAPDVHVDLVADAVRLEPGQTQTFRYSGTATGTTIREYQWDFDGNGTVDQVTYPGAEGGMQHVYNNRGTYYASVVALANNGDWDTAHWCTQVGEGGFSGEELIVTLPGDVPLAMIRIPAGTFMMGRYPGEQDSYDREDPQHQVTLSQDFYLGKYELTKRQWQAVMGTTPWSGQSYVLNDLDSPAVYVSWDNAKSFITALNAHITSTGQGAATFRLPTEAEWEYACRAGTTTRFYWGDDPSYTVGNDYCWWRYNAWDVNEQYTHVVGLKLPNAFSLYDMSGNAWEWCEDDWHSSYTGAPVNGSAWVDSPRGSRRVLRGGSWDLYGFSCRSASRHSYAPTYTYVYLGFRLAR